VADIRGESECLVPAEDCLRMTEICLKLRDRANGRGITDLT
jgi:hypothetical protein